MPNAQAPDPPPSRRRARIGLRRVLAILVVAALAPVAAFVVWGRIETRRLARALDAVEARGEPLDVDRLKVVATTDEQRQASHYYAEAGRLIEGADGPRVNAIGKTIEELCALPAGDPGRTARAAALRRAEAPYAGALALLDRATALDAHGWDDRDRPLPQAVESMRPRYLAAVNALRIARVACADAGDGEEAAAALLGTVRLSRIVSASFLPGLSTSSGHGLQSTLTWTAPSEPALERLQDAYAAAADDRALERWLIFSRARSLSWMLPGELSEAPAGYFDRRREAALARRPRRRVRAGEEVLGVARRLAAPPGVFRRARAAARQTHRGLDRRRRRTARRRVARPIAGQRRRARRRAVPACARRRDPRRSRRSRSRLARRSAHRSVHRRRAEIPA